MAKKVNYSKEQIAQLIGGYNPEADAETRKAQVEALAVALSRKPASIIAKLSSMKHYTAKVYTNKNGETSVRKGVIVDMIAEAMGESAESFDTLAKANKTVLESIWNFVKPEEVVADENDSQEPEGDTA